MDRILEPEIMNDMEQAIAYDQADFSESHNRIVTLFRSLAKNNDHKQFLDLGCGSGDVLQRFATQFKNAKFTGVDGSQAMINIAQKRIDNEKLSDRVQFSCAFIPSDEIPNEKYDVVMSNSFLHHLHNPNVLWQTFKKHAKSETLLFTYDLSRPKTKEDARNIVKKYASNEAPILQEDFYNSLCAAFTPEEIKEQLQQNDLNLEVEKVSDFHVMVHGVYKPKVT